jgi:NRE family putative nickel resistance protein-like MFS transporter
MKTPQLFRVLLNNPIFAQIYFAQTINLIGDAFTWLGLGLLAFELAQDKAGIILATALTLRVITFVIISPIAGVLADRVDRKKVMFITHLARMFLVSLLPFVNTAWQFYAIVLSLNIFYAFFTPTYTATIPLVTNETDYKKAIALSSATYQLLGVLGPGLAGGLASIIGTRQIFFLDAITFALATILIVTLPKKLIVNQSEKKSNNLTNERLDILTGSFCIFNDPLIRYGLLMQMVVSIAGANILVNTVSYVQATLQLGKLEYGWVMASFGIGATLASISLGYLYQQKQPTFFLNIGAIVMTLVLFPANHINLSGLLILWLLAGIGQTLVNLTMQTMIAERVALEIQGRVYGAHFAWSHLWWVFAYPLAGWMGNKFPDANFFFGSLVSSILLIIAYILFKPNQVDTLNTGIWHEHLHQHDLDHAHYHSSFPTNEGSHSHIHFHKSIFSKDNITK